MTTYASAKTGQQNFSLTLSICKQSPGPDTRCHPCTTRSRRQIYVQKDLCLLVVRSWLRNVKIAPNFTAVLIWLWTALFTPSECLRNALPGKAKERASEKGRESELVFVYWFLKLEYDWCDVMGNFYFFACFANQRVAVVAGLSRSNSPQRVKEFQWAVGLTQQLPARRPRKMCRQIYLRVTLPNPTCMDRLTLVPNSCFTCSVILLPKRLRQLLQMSNQRLSCGITWPDGFWRASKLIKDQGGPQYLLFTQNTGWHLDVEGFTTERHSSGKPCMIRVYNKKNNWPPWPLQNKVWSFLSNLLK